MIVLRTSTSRPMLVHGEVTLSNTRLRNLSAIAIRSVGSITIVADREIKSMSGVVRGARIVITNSSIKTTDQIKRHQAIRNCNPNDYFCQGGDPTNIQPWGSCYGSDCGYNANIGFGYGDIIDDSTNSDCQFSFANDKVGYCNVVAMNLPSYGQNLFVSHESALSFNNTCTYPKGVTSTWFTFFSKAMYLHLETLIFQTSLLQRLNYMRRPHTYQASPQRWTSTPLQRIGHFQTFILGTVIIQGFKDYSAFHVPNVARSS